MCSYCGDSGVYGAPPPPPAPVAGERAEYAKRLRKNYGLTLKDAMELLRVNDWDYYKAEVTLIPPAPGSDVNCYGMVRFCHDCNVRHEGACPPAPGARKEGSWGPDRAPCGCVVIHSNEPGFAKIDMRTCKYSAIDVVSIGNTPPVRTPSGAESSILSVIHPPAAAPPLKVVLHKRGTRGEGWESCSWDEDERTKECIDFEGKPYEHADFVPATAVADAVRAEREACAELAYQYGGFRYGQSKGADAIRARSRDGEGK